MASGSTPLAGETKGQYGRRMTEARKRNPKRVQNAVNSKASSSVADW